MTNSIQRAFLALSFALFFVAIIPGEGLAQSRGGKRKPAVEKKESKQEGESEQEREREEYEREEHENASRPRTPLPWGGGIVVEPIEGASDTVSFHIGSPLFLRLKLSGDIACEPFNGQPFYFDASGAQLGWGFEEVRDSLLFPTAPGSCERIIMLSSENSNRIAEGTYSMKVLLFLDEKSRLYSDTIFVHPVHSASGADTLSYSRFLLEQIIHNTPLLHEPETIQALFAEGTPRSAESEVYHALILYRGGDIAGAEKALLATSELTARRNYPLDRAASAVAGLLAERLHVDISNH
jgi:hypothetical protein